MDLKNIGIISQVRMSSTRLPGKVLKEIKGVPLLKYQINRLKTAHIPIYLATTTNDSDNVIEEFAYNENLYLYRGSELDVLDRFYRTAKKFNIDVVIRITSDCPLIDGDLIKRALDKYIRLNDPNIYLSNVSKRTFPRGFDFEIFSISSLEHAFKHATSSFYREHVTPYIRDNHSGNIIVEEFISELDGSEYRLTVDTEEDFELIKILIDRYDCDKLNYLEIIKVLKNNPHLSTMNAHIEQKKN